MLIELGSARFYELLTEDGQGGKESATAASTGAVKNAASSIFLRVVEDHSHPTGAPTCDTTTSTCAMKRARIFAVFFLLVFPASIAQQPLQLPAEQDMCPNKPFGFGRNQSSIGMQPVQSAARLLFLPLPFEVYDRIFAPICAFLRGDDYGTSLVVKVYSGPHENLIRTQVLRISGE